MWRRTRCSSTSRACDYAELRSKVTAPTRENSRPRPKVRHNANIGTIVQLQFRELEVPGEPLPLVVEGGEHLLGGVVQPGPVLGGASRVDHCERGVELFLRPGALGGAGVGDAIGPVGDVEVRVALVPLVAPGPKRRMGVGGTDEVSPDVSPAPQRVDAVEPTDRLVDAVEVGTYEQAPAAFERARGEVDAQVDWQVRLVRIVHRRPKYRRTCSCGPAGVLVAPPVPKPIAKGLFTSGFLARLLTEKFVLGRPLHRIAAALRADGLCVSEGTLSGVMQTLSGHLAPLDQLIRARNAASAHLHIDETSWKVFEAVADKDGFKWWLWVFLGADTTVFILAPDRSSDLPACCRQD